MRLTPEECTVRAHEFTAEMWHERRAREDRLGRMNRQIQLRRDAEDAIIARWQSEGTMALAGKLVLQESEKAYLEVFGGDAA